MKHPGRRAARSGTPWKERTIRTLLTFIVAAVAAAGALAYAGLASAHEIITNNGVSVEFHFAPEDEPVAGGPATITIESVRVRKGTFSWRTCRCAISIAASSGKVLYRNTAAKSRTKFVFPVTGAYEVTFTGRVKRAGHWRTFKVSDPVRAS